MVTVRPESEPSLYFHVSDPPYENYFYADPIVSCQAVLASPLPRSSSPAVHRLLFAWPAGNSAAAAFFQSQEPKDDALSIQLKTGPHGRVLDSIKYEPDDTSRSGYPSVGVSGLLEISNTAVLSLAILGSVRTVRDYTEGHAVLNPKVQNSIRVHELDGQKNGVRISRVWFDEKTTTHLTFAPANSATTMTGAIAIAKDDSETIATFAPGFYSFQAHLNYPQSPYMRPAQLLKPSFHHLISLQPDAVKALSFLCTSDKILAGAWRFLTYFGRDSMISLLLLNPVLSEGEHGAIEVGLSAVLERIDREDGSVCHEENIGDYPAAQAVLDGNGSPDAQYDYKMVALAFTCSLGTKLNFIGRHGLLPADCDEAVFHRESSGSEAARTLLAVIDPALANNGSL